MSDQNQYAPEVEASPTPIIPAEIKELEDKELPELSEVLRTLPPEKSQLIRQELQMMTAVQQESFSGPIPHPRILQGYESIKEGFAERILHMTEKEQDHRFKSEDKMIDATIRSNSQGQWMGLTIAVIFAGAAVWLGGIDQTVVASILGGLDLVSLVTVFVSNQFLNRGNGEKPKQKSEGDIELE